MSTTDLDVLPEPPEAVFRLSVEQYHTMIEAGVFADDERVELLEGILVRKMSKNPPHRIVVGNLLELMFKTLPAGWHYQSQDPVTLSDGEPEPDGAVARGARGDYRGGHPTPADVPLVIEVADSSLRLDRGIKLRSYARAGIGEYWIVNLVDGVVEVYTRPGRKGRWPAYLDTTVRTRGDVLRLPIGGDVTIEVEAIFARA